MLQRFNPSINPILSHFEYQSSKLKELKWLAEQSNIIQFE